MLFRTSVTMICLCFGPLVLSQEAVNPVLALKRKCAGYLTEASKKCRQQERTSTGFIFKSCPGIPSGSYKLIQMSDSHHFRLNEGKVCSVSVRENGKADWTIEETAYGTKLKIESKDASSLAKVIGTDGKTAYLTADDDGTGFWRVKREDGNIAFIPDSDVQAMLEGKDIKLPEEKIDWSKMPPVYDTLSAGSIQ